MEYDHSILKKTRLARGLSIQQIALDLCLSARQIESLENNLPDFFYSNALKLVSVKKYAQALELKESDVLRFDSADTYKDEPSNKSRSDLKGGNDLIIEEKLGDFKTPQKNIHKERKLKDLANHAVIKKATHYIQASLHGEIMLPDLAKVTGYSERSIQFIFQKHFKQTPFQYIEEQRLLKARALIEAYGQSKKVADIAHDVGFSHMGRFAGRFKKRFGISPSSLARSVS